ncbi:hypothetical protein, partial [Helicobacter sp. T3_23-1056]
MPTTRERERERVTPAQNFSSYKSSKYHTYKETSVITDNDSASVIASERSERDNPQCNTANIDCHENPSGFSRNDDGRVDCYKSANADSRNDGIISPSLCGGGLRGWVSYPNTHKRTIQNPNPCHTEGVARSISKSKNVSRDISRSRAQYDKNSVITDNDSISVIASERSERGNLFFTHCSVDCHEFSLFDKSLNSRNDDEMMDCHDSTLRAYSRNDE